MSSPETQHAVRGWLASRVVRILAGPLLLLAVLAGLLGFQVQHLLDRMAWVEETCQAIAQGNALHRLFADQESSLRGYLLTQDRAVLDRFYARRTEIGPALSTLSALVAGERSQVELLGGLGADHAAWERLAEAEIEGRARPGHRPEPAERGRRMEQMRAGIEAFVAHAEALRLSRITSVATQTRDTIVTGTAAFFFFAGGLALVSRRRIEEADAIFRRASDAESRLRRLWESNIIGVLYADDRGNITETNDALLGMVGFTREDLAAGRVRWADMTPPEYADADQRGIAEVTERGACTPYEKAFVAKDGRRVPVLLGYARLESERARYLAFILDLTERRRAEAQLREGEARFRTMVDALPALAWTTMPDGHVEWLNQALLDYTGAEPSELTGWSWHGIHDPELLPTVLSTWKASLASGTPFEMELPLRAAHDLPARSQPAPSPPVRTRVLVIDDNIDGAESIRDVLALEGHTVEVAFSGVEGLEKARVFEPDVVLCDIGLPGMSGYEVARALRAESGRRVPRLVALTGYAGPDDVARSLEAGFDAHLAKPPTVEKLEEALEGRQGR